MAKRTLSRSNVGKYSNVAASAAAVSLGGAAPITNCVEPHFVDSGLTELTLEIKFHYICTVYFKGSLRVRCKSADVMSFSFLSSYSRNIDHSAV